MILLKEMAWKKRSKAGDSSGKSIVFSTFKPPIHRFDCRITILIQCPKLILLKEMVWKKRSKAGDSSGKSVVFFCVGPNSNLQFTDSIVALLF